jgi:anti-anti-sigma regulatory factor
MDDITIETSQDDAQGGRTVTVSGRATIEQAFTFREALLESLQAAKEVRVDVSGLTGVDLTGLQLLCAAHQSAEKAGKRFLVSDGGNETFLGVVADAGFQRHVGCACDTSSSCIWVRGDN